MAVVVVVEVVVRSVVAEELLGSRPPPVGVVLRFGRLGIEVVLGHENDDAKSARVAQSFGDIGGQSDQPAVGKLGLELDGLHATIVAGRPGGGTYDVLMTEGTKWVWYAILGALFAAVVQLVSKPAVDRMDVSAVNLIRGAVTFAVFVGIVTWEGRWGHLRETKPFPLAMSVLGGAAAGASWFFGYQALKLAGVAKSYPIDKLSVVFAVLLAFLVLGEKPSVWNWVGIVVVLVGAYMVTLKTGS